LGGQKPMQDEDLKTKELAAEIGYSEMPLGADPNEGVAFDWSQWTLLPGSGSEWKSIYSGVQYLPPAVRRKFDYRRGQEELALEVFVASSGPQPARRRLLEIGATTMMPSSPYKKGPEDLGDLSIVPRSGRTNSIAWTYHNLCFHLETQNTQFNLMTLAYELQKEAARGLVKNIHQHAPVAVSAIARPQPASVGDIVTIELYGSGHPDPQKVDTYFKIEGDGLRAVSQDKSNLTLKFMAVKPGITRIGVQVADKQTLLSTTGAVAVKVVERHGS